MCFGGRGKANVKMIVFVLRLAFPYFTLMTRASVTPCGPSSPTISSTLHAATSRERMTPLQVLSVRCGVTFTGTTFWTEVNNLLSPVLAEAICGD